MQVSSLLGDLTMNVQPQHKHSQHCRYHKGEMRQQVRQNDKQAEQVC